MNSEISSLLCNDALVKSHLLKHLYNLAQTEENQKKFREAVFKQVNIDCLLVIKNDIKEIIYRGLSPASEQSFAYRLLTSFDEISKEENELLLTLHLLGGPINDGVFNLSWNNLRQLGQNHRKREKVFISIKKLNALPGKIFATLNQQRKNVILEHIYNNFPEYLEFYAQTCINYLSGEGRFPDGNPTPNCKEFFDSAINQKKPWPQNYLKDKYRYIKNKNTS
ncbi:MAG: hypothetical protein HQK53_10230 [Oligoflexia bacterium]|nr:hypothetical protein [Oligoflexia bacterium]